MPSLGNTLAGLVPIVGMGSLGHRVRYVPELLTVCYPFVTHNLERWLFNRDSRQCPSNITTTSSIDSHSSKPTASPQLCRCRAGYRNTCSSPSLRDYSRKEQPHHASTAITRPTTDIIACSVLTRYFGGDHDKPGSAVGEQIPQHDA